jgi:hypothetical protein
VLGRSQQSQLNKAKLPKRDNREEQDLVVIHPSQKTPKDSGKEIVWMN